MLTFQRMSGPEYQEYYQQSLEVYAQEAVSSGSWSTAEARQQAAQQYASILSQGQDTPGHAFYHLLDTARDERVGTLWIMTRGEGQHRHTFIYAIDIHPDQQGRGYGTQALEHLKTEAQAQGARSIRLHVFANNAVARHLYEKMGFYPTNINMRLDLEP